MQRSDLPRWSRVQVLLDQLRGSLWTIPIVWVVGAVVAALVAVRIDEAVDHDSTGLAFGGGPESARAALSAIASSMLSLTALVFSVQIVTLQLTSSQFSPRALRNYLRDRTSQVALGVFLATFSYALAALREVRGDVGDTERFVPGFTITLAFALVALSVVVFINYIHHSAQSIRVVNIIARIAEETTSAIDNVYPEKALSRPAAPDVPRKTLPASRSGVIQAVEERRLVHLAVRYDLMIWIEHPVGEFVPAGAPLLRVARLVGEPLDGKDQHKLERKLVDSVVMGAERTMKADPAFGLRQLVDIAERALSPGLNDPTTAIQCIDQIHAILRLLATRAEPDEVHVDNDGAVRLITPVRHWPELVRLGFDEIRHWGARSVQVHRRLNQALADLAGASPPQRRGPIVEQQRLLRERMADLPLVEQVNAESW